MSSPEADTAKHHTFFFFFSFFLPSTGKLSALASSTNALDVSRGSGASASLARRAPLLEIASRGETLRWLRGRDLQNKCLEAQFVLAHGEEAWGAQVGMCRWFGEIDKDLLRRCPGLGSFALDAALVLDNRSSLWRSHRLARRLQFDESLVILGQDFHHPLAFV